MFTASSLDPNHPRWREMSRHNPVVSRLVKESCDHFAQGMRNPLMYATAHRLAAQCVPMRKSKHQKMLVNVALGLALSGMDFQDEAASALYLALDLAHETHDYVVAFELYDQVGANLRGQGRMEEAAEFYEEGLHALDALGGLAANKPMALQFELGLATSRLVTGDYPATLLHLPIARELARQKADAIMLARLDLTTANVHTARGDVHAALPLILAARDAFAHATTPSQRMMLARLHAIAAGALLDVAEVYARRGRDVRGLTYVTLADDFAQQALNLAAEINDVGAVYLGTLARARHERISGRRSTSMNLLTALLADADKHDDPHLRVQVHTAIGQDHAARGDHDRARAHYQLAVQGANECGNLYSGEYAKRELVRASVGQ